MSFNVYFGAYGIRDALAQGAQIVVTGRCADSALVLGPLMFEYGWSVESCRSLERYYDLLASASLAGHIIECGCHATGGNFTDWRLSADSDCGGWSNVGFPIVDFSPDGSFVVTKPARTGGLVSVATVSEQLVYEIGDPTAYLLPDVIVDMSHTTLKQLAPDRVWVSGARGRPPTAFFKTSSTYFDGYRITAELMIGGFEARIKVSIYLSLHILCARSLARSALMPSPQAQRVADAILTRARRMLAFRKLPDFLHTEIEIIGAEHTYGPRSRVADLAREVTLRIGVHHTDPTALAIFGKEVAPVCLASAPSHTHTSLPFSHICIASLPGRSEYGSWNHWRRLWTTSPSAARATLVVPGQQEPRASERLGRHRVCVRARHSGGVRRAGHDASRRHSSIELAHDLALAPFDRRQVLALLRHLRRRHRRAAHCTLHRSQRRQGRHCQHRNHCAQARRLPLHQVVRDGRASTRVHGPPDRRPRQSL